MTKWLERSFDFRAEGGPRLENQKAMMLRCNDSPKMPGTGEGPEVRLARALPLLGTPGQKYVETRGISVIVAHNAGVRFDADWNGRAAVGKLQMSGVSS